MTKASFHDYHTATYNLRDAVVDGLSQARKSIPPKFFYDERGSELFDRICDQPEYYPPSVERDILRQRAQEIASLAGTGRVLIEPGAGNATKLRLLVDALRPSACVPMDISCDYLKCAAIELAKEYPWMAVHAACVDHSLDLPIPEQVPPQPRLFFYPGSSIGNLNHDEAADFLRRVRAALGAEGMLLIGVDTKKSEAVLNAAYNDAAGVTAQFNLNLLHRIRNELGADVDPEGFAHKAFFNAEAGRIEMHLVSKRRQTLSFDEHSFEFAAGETLHTENSYKYAPEEFLDLAQHSGFSIVRHWLDEQDLFAVYLFAAA